MDSTTPAQLDEVTQLDQATRSKKTETKGQIRGSSLLLAGHVLAKGANFLVQVLIVRYLSQTDYGAFAYALAVVHLGKTVATFGLDRAITRFVPIYHEQGEYNKLFGTIVMVVSTIVSLGLALALLLHGGQRLIARSFVSDQQAMGLLLLLIFLAPIHAIDDLFVGLFAVFAKPRAIFFRKHILAPGLRLIVVSALVLSNGTVFVLASGYLAAGVLGVVIYAVMLFRTMRDQGLFRHFNIGSLNFPWREVLWFTIPLLTSELVYIVMNTLDAVMLEYFRNITDVAALRAVQPAAVNNRLVMTSFATLFTPLAARMFARQDREGINNLYWQTAIWIAIFSFPIFALTFSLARPITLLLYGARYEQSAIILALLSFGYYFHAALGFNGITLKVYGKLRYIVTLNILAAVGNVGLNLLLIPRYGALGAAVGTVCTLILHNILKQAGLRLGTGINLFEWRYFKVYLTIAASALGLLLIQSLTSAPVYISILLAGLASFLVFWLNRRLLDIEKTFPELLHVPLFRLILGSSRRPA